MTNPSSLQTKTEEAPAAEAEVAVVEPTEETVAEPAVEAPVEDAVVETEAAPVEEVCFFFSCPDSTYNREYGHN